MTKSDLAELYNRTCQGYNRLPLDGEFDAWVVVLGREERPDLDAALRRWQSDTQIEEFSQRPKGARFPQPAELKASIEGWERAHSQRFRPCGKCNDGFVLVRSERFQGVKLCDCLIEWQSSARANR